jgi:hypothetical protein
MKTKATVLACLLSLSLSLAAGARADPIPVTKPPAHVGQPSTTWGWVLVVTGVAAGAAVTSYGLTFDCSDSDVRCQRGASMAIGSGVGIAALASAVGLAIVELGLRR